MSDILQTLRPSENRSYREKNFFRTSSLVNGVIIFFLASSLFLGWFINYTFRIKKVTILSPKKISLSFLIGSSILFFDESDVTSQILQKYPLIYRITFSKIYPSSLTVSVSFLTPQAQIVQKDSSIIIGQNSTVISTASHEVSSIPRIYYFQDLAQYEQKIGVRLRRKDILYAYQLLKQKNKFGISFNAVTITGPNHFMLVDEEKRLTVLLSAKKTIDINAEICKNSMRGLSVKGIKPRIINVEFDKPIITL